MSIANLKKPANLWLIDVFQNLDGMLAKGEDPAMTLEFNGVVLEMRLKRVPGRYERVQVALDKKLADTQVRKVGRRLR